MRHGNTRAKKVIFTHRVLLRYKSLRVCKGKEIIKFEGTYDTRYVRHEVPGHEVREAQEHVDHKAREAHEHVGCKARRA